MSNLKLYRIFAGGAAALASIFPLFVVGSHVARGFEGLDLLQTCMALPFAAAALVLGAFALNGGDPETRRRTAGAILGAIGVGVVAFAAGFLGPIVLTPEANQGPLLGIFFTGPAGFALGAALGWIVQLVRSRGRTATR